MRTLDLLRAAGVLEAVDVHLASTLARLGGDPRDEIALGVSLASARTRDGHVCLDLPGVVTAPLHGSEGEPVASFSWPNLEAWLVALRASPLVSDGAALSPLVLDDRGRLYLRRYFDLERSLARSLRARAAILEDVDSDLLRAGLDRLFGPLDRRAPLEGQRLAAVVALSRRFAVIAGGPGTGKTSTVVKLLALLIEQARARGLPPPLLTLVAPTGKAAARLTESIAKERSTLACDEQTKAALHASATTIHRALGVVPGSSTRFRHDELAPLLANVVLVDEASMVDLALMSRLVAAVRPDARLLLLGDRDQLASVEAGAILGDICDAPADGGFSREYADRLAAITGHAIDVRTSESARPGVGDSVVHLSRSYRYAASSGIGALARAINLGDAHDVLRLLRDGADGSIALAEPTDDGRLSERLRALAVEQHAIITRAREPLARLEALGRFRVLVAHRRGAFGVDAQNRFLERALADDDILRPDRALYDGRPILITENDYATGLFNGDIGVCLRDGDDEIRAYFQGKSGLRALAPSRLPAYESVFAMTIHKSQGSEFDEVAIVLPASASAVLSRELLYTAVTRARARVTLFANEEVIARAVSIRVDRASGLRDALRS